MLSSCGQLRCEQLRTATSIGGKTCASLQSPIAETEVRPPCPCGQTQANRVPISALRLHGAPGKSVCSVLDAATEMNSLSKDQY